MQTRAIEQVQRKVKARSAKVSTTIQKVPAQAKQLEQMAEASLKKAAASASTLAKKYPAAAAGALVGAGVLVGVVATKALHHEPTVGELVMGAIKRGTSRASKQISKTAAAGVRAGKRSLR